MCSLLSALLDCGCDQLSRAPAPELPTVTNLDCELTETFLSPSCFLSECFTTALETTQGQYPYLTPLSAWHPKSSGDDLHCLPGHPGEVVHVRLPRPGPAVSPPQEPPLLP